MKKTNEKEKVVQLDIFRHGQAKYREGKGVNFFEANDLTPEGVKTVMGNAKKIAHFYDSGSEVPIFTSPYGRTLQTSKLIAGVLMERNIKIEVVPFQNLEEIRHFNGPLLKALMEGGEIELDGEKFTIDKKLSNPKNLGYPDYYCDDCISQIPFETLAFWPKKLVKAIQKIEKYSSVDDRMMNFLFGIKKDSKTQKAIVVTHDALVMGLTSGCDKRSLDPGNFIQVEIFSNELSVYMNR